MFVLGTRWGARVCTCRGSSAVRPCRSPAMPGLKWPEAGRRSESVVEMQLVGSNAVVTGW